MIDICQSFIRLPQTGQLPPWKRELLKFLRPLNDPGPRPIVVGLLSVCVPLNYAEDKEVDSPAYPFAPDVASPPYAGLHRVSEILGWSSSKINIYYTI